jgi:hypothetical protein
MPNESQVLAQSKAAYGQWKEQWREQAKTHSEYKMKSLLDFENIGVGRTVLCVANGYSFEENIETIKAHRENIDILCCDKTLGHLLDNGIVPTYCLVCDANVSFEKYLEPYKDQVKNVVLFINVCANPKWTEGIAWKDRYFFVNKDILQSEKEFSALSGCDNLIPAATNVSNAMVVLLTQSDNGGRVNFFGYDKICLIGYDYSWKADGKYYAFDKDGDGKTHYMRHIHALNEAGDYVYTSGNLAFSASWLEKYVTTFKLPVVQCSKSGIMGQSFGGDLAKNLSYRYKPQDATLVRELIERLNKARHEARKLDTVLKEISRDHYRSYVASRY